MSIAWVIILIVILIAALLGIATAVYMTVYKRRIARRLSEGKSDGKRMMSPSVFFVIALVCMIPLGLTLTTLIARSIYSAQFTAADNAVRQPYIKAVSEDALENSPFEGYTIGADIKGYVRTDYTDGNVTFHCYRAQDCLYGFLPRVLVSVENSDDLAILHLDMEYNDGDIEGSSRYTGTSESAVLYALDCYRFEGTFDFDFSGFTEGEYPEGSSDLDDEFFSNADVKGRFSLDMSYPIEN